LGWAEGRGEKEESGRAFSLASTAPHPPARRQFHLDHRLRRLPVAQAGQHLATDLEQRHGGDAGLFADVPHGPAVALPVLAARQRRLEFLLVQADLAGQPGQHIGPADVLSLHKEGFEDPVVVRVALALLPGVIVALEGQVRVRLGRNARQGDRHAHPAGDGVDEGGNGTIQECPRFPAPVGRVFMAWS
jgi:hypothetical protein